MITATWLVLIGAGAVGAAAYFQLTLPLVAAGAAAVVLGAIAARLMYAEVLDTRFDAAADRADQARGYRTLANRRARETQQVVDLISGHLDEAREESARVVSENEDLKAEVATRSQQAKAAAERARLEAARADAAERAATAFESRAVEAEARAEKVTRRVVELEQVVAEHESAALAQRDLRDRHTA